MSEPKHRNPNMQKRVASSGRVYYVNLDIARKKSTRKNDIPPFMHSKSDEHYLRYFERKQKIRSEYPFWNQMTMSQWKEYFGRIYTLMLTDEDYLYWINVVNETEKQKGDRGRLERKIQKSKDYPNGFTCDEY